MIKIMLKHKVLFIVFSFAKHPQLYFVDKYNDGMLGKKWIGEGRYIP